MFHGCALKPFAVQDFVDCWSRLWVIFKHTEEEIFDILREMFSFLFAKLPVSFWVILNHLVNFVLFTSIISKWRGSGKHDEENDSH